MVAQENIIADVGGLQTSSLTLLIPITASMEQALMDLFKAPGQIPKWCQPDFMEASGALPIHTNSVFTRIFNR